MRVTRRYCSDACRKRAARRPELAAPPPPHYESKPRHRAALARVERFAEFMSKSQLTLKAIRDRERLVHALHVIKLNLDPLLGVLGPALPEPEAEAPQRAADIPRQPLDDIIGPPAGGFMR
jgi:hypothetical protein